MKLSTVIKAIVPLLLGGLTASRAGAQTPDTVVPAMPPRAPLVLGAYAQGSIILAHTYAIKHLVASHPTGFELNLQRQTTGAAPWHGWYKFPKVGVALTYYDFHNPVLGYIFSASPYLSKSFSRGAKHDLSFRLGAGLAYLTNPYDQVEPQKHHCQLGPERHHSAAPGVRLRPYAALGPAGRRGAEPLLQRGYQQAQLWSKPAFGGAGS